MKPLTRRLLIVAAALGVVAAAVQMVPVERSNPPVDAALVAPAEVLEVLRGSCFDCHSHETRWPWYSRVAPVSWLVAHDVEEGRDHLNFSLWANYEQRRRQKLAEDIWEEVDRGEMPLPVYLLAHRDARLTASDREVLRSWSASVAGGR